MLCVLSHLFAVFTFYFELNINKEINIDPSGEQSSAATLPSIAAVHISTYRRQHQNMRMCGLVRGFGTASHALREEVHCARFEVTPVLIVRIQVFWVVTPSSLVVDFRRFEVNYAFICKGH
jgi:hypothetical protein